MALNAKATASANTIDPESLVIWGAGAIGGAVGASFVRAGLPVVFVDIDADHVAAITHKGLRIEGPIDNYLVAARAALPEQFRGRFKTIFLCVKAHHTEQACQQLLPHLHADGAVVSMQNGLNELTIADIVGSRRTIGAFVNFGADYHGPGLIHYGGHGAVVVGEVDGSPSDRVTELHQQLLLFDKNAILTGNVLGYLWAKMSYGAMLYATALTNEAIADVLDMPEYRSVFISLAREVLDVAAAQGIVPEAFDGYDPFAFSGRAGLAQSSLDQLVAHNRRSTKTHSGIWRDLAIRKRKTEVDAQLGPIVSIGMQRGVATPMTERLITLIHDVESGKRALSLNSLSLLDITC